MMLQQQVSGFKQKDFENPLMMMKAARFRLKEVSALKRR
jgi:hypothetical protein